MTSDTEKRAISNDRLRHERERRAWTQERVAQELFNRCTEEELSKQRGSVNSKMVGDWERGVHMPSFFWRVKLVELYEKSLEELHLVVQYNRRQGYTKVSSHQQVASERDKAEMNRREAMKKIGAVVGTTLFATPDELLNPQPWEQVPAAFAKLPPVDTLSHLEKLTEACWYLMKASELNAVELALPKYLPTLETLVKQPSEYQMKAAGLASQSYQLIGLVRLHQNNFPARQVYCERAVYYSRLTHDRNLQTSALVHLANMFYYGNQPVKALRTYQEALPYINDVSPSLSGRVYVMLAESYARCKQKEQAQRYVGLAHESFARHSEDDGTLLYSDYALSSLYLWEGLTYLALGQHYPDGDYYHQAWDSFALIGGLQPGLMVSERNRIETVIHQAGIAIALGDQELFRTYLIEGVTGAKTLGSEKRFLEALTTFEKAQLVWRNEQRVNELVDLFVR
jgi:tetratricopeptide (TPR) repeat protein